MAHPPPYVYEAATREAAEAGRLFSFLGVTTILEAVLQYQAPAGGASVQVGRTSDPYVLRVLRDSLLKEATQEARIWRDFDPSLEALKAVEVKRLATVLNLLLPEEDDLSPKLELIELERLQREEDPGEGGGPQPGR